MEENEDTVMGGSHGHFPATSLSSHPVTHPPAQAHLRPDLMLAPSILPQAVPASPSPGSEPLQPQDSLPIRGTDGMAQPDGSEGSVIRRDSLEEPNSDWSDDEATIVSGLPLASLATGLCYDNRMRYHCEVRPSTDVHPEDPRRIYYIYKELCRSGLVNDPHWDPARALLPLQRISARDATKEEISLVHTDAHYAFVESTKEMSNDVLIELERNRDSIYFNKLTFSTALLSAGGAIETCLAVATRKVKNAIAVIRPPGHHAEGHAAMGFCVFNNVSVAARVCQRELGDKCRKIMILDWDVHHGNGIQKAFYDDPNVLYISIHVFKNGDFYPGGPEGGWDHNGDGAGIGMNINIPWDEQGMGDGDYMFAFQQVVMPIAEEFNPDLIIIAAGFDAAAGDVLGGCFVSPSCYSHMTHMLMSLANGKVVVCLEGGYNFRSISKSALAVTKTLMGESPGRLQGAGPTPSAIKTVRRVMAIQSGWWKSNSSTDAIRAHQAKDLYDSFKLTSLYVYRKGVSKSFENQVLARPELIGQPDPVNNKLELHNCWLADVSKEYITWITRQGYAVIDVNIPKHVTKPSVSRNFRIWETLLNHDKQSSYQYEDNDTDRPSATEDLAGYIWDNYIEPNPIRKIFFLGVGESFTGISSLLINRESLYQRVSGVISFVDKNPVRAVTSHTQVWLSKWYRENSLVIASHTHGVWEPDRRRAKRYGQLVRSPQEGLSEMLQLHKDEVFKFIVERVEKEEEEEGKDSNMED
ncbi:uncharacterized protein PFLUO_LOCUS5754 [Penicillium psychrofluorescens]|uniref:uncharacterized protein n=1 Tax=Penicillium psychrofluorescens TaxID=3158075 RepID=UPI003CCDA869